MIAVALALQAVVWAAVAAVFAVRRSASLFHPLAFYLVFHLLVFVVRPVLVHIAGFDAQWFHMRFTPTPEVFVRTLLVSSVALVVFAACALAAGPREARPPARPAEATPAERLAFHGIFLLLLPLALYSARLDAQLFGTLTAVDGLGMRVDPLSGHTVFVGTSGYLAKAHNLLIPLAALFVYVNRFRWWAWLPLLALVGWRLYLGSRWGVVVVLGIVLLLHLYRHRRSWLRARYVALALPVFLAFHAVGQHRDAFREMTGLGAPRFEAAAAERQGSFLRSLDNPDFANFDFLAYIVAAVPERSQTYTYFTQHLEVLTRPVPRVLWPDKPVGPPVQRVRLNDYGWFGHRTRALVGDGWMSLGWAGVALTMAAAGSALGRFQRWFQNRNDQLFPVAVYACLLPATLLLYRGGNLASTAEMAMWLLLPVGLWWLAARVLGWQAAQAVRRPAP